MRGRRLALLFAAAWLETACAATPGERDAWTTDASPDAVADGEVATDATDAGDTRMDVGARDGSDAGNDAADAASDDAGASDAGPDCGTVSLPPLLTFNLRTAPFPDTGHPDVAVHVPDRFNPWDRVGVVVFFHGFDNCVVNVVGSVDTACTDGGSVRNALHLIDQLDAAAVNAILVAVELRYDTASSDAGQLATAGDFYALLHELFAEHLNPLLGRDLDVPDLDRVVLASHSGGYHAVAKCLAVGQVPNVREVQLYDSLYGDIATYDAWLQNNIDRFDVTRPDELKFMDVYSTSAGTAANSMNLASDVATWLGAAGLSSSLLYDDTTSTLAPEDFLHPVLIKHSALSHNGVPQYYFSRLLAASGFAPLP